MFTQLTNILKWFTNLTDVKRVIAIMAAFIIFLTYFFIKRDKENTRMHNDIKLEYRKRLDTCENHSMTLQQQVSYWKDSLANEKLNNAIEEINRFKGIAKEVKKVEKDIKNTNKNIKNKQKQVLNKLANEE